MTADALGRILLAVDTIGLLWLIGLAWIDLRTQTSDTGRVGGVVALAALAFVLYYVGRALLGL